MAWISRQASSKGGEDASTARRRVETVVRLKSWRYGVHAVKATGPAGIVQLVSSGTETNDVGLRMLPQNADFVSSISKLRTEVVLKSVARRLVVAPNIGWSV